MAPVTNVGFATLSIIPSAKGFGAALSRDTDPQMDRAGRQSGSRFGRVWASASIAPMRAIGTAALGFFAFDKAKDFLKGAVTEASDLNEAGNKMQVVFGTATADVMKFAGGGAKALGQSKLAVMDAAATFGVYGKAAGLAGKHNAQFSSGLVQLSTDLSSFYNADISETIAAIGSGLRGEAEPLRRFGVLLDDATMRGEALRMGLIKTTKQALTPQQKVLAAHAVIMRQTKVAQGDFARTSGGLANQQRILSAQWADAKGKIGAFFLPAMTAAVKGLNGLFAGLGKVRSGLGAVARSDAFAQIIGAADTFWGALTGKGNATGFADSLNGDVIGTLKVAGRAVRNVGATFISTWRSIAAQALPVLGRLVATFRSHVLPALAALGAYIATNLVPIFAEWRRILVTQVYPIIAQIATFVVGTLVPRVAALAVAIGERLRPVFDAIADVLRQHVLPLIRDLLAKFQEWWPTIQRVVGLLLTVVGWLLKLAATILAKVLPPVIKFAGFLLGTVARAIATVLGWIVKIVGGILDFGSAIGRAVGKVGEFVSGLKQRLGEAVDFVKGLPGRIVSALGNLGGTLLESGKDLVRGFIDGIKSMAGEIISAIKSAITDRLPGFVKKALGIQSPSRVFAALGRHTAEGFAVGVSSRSGHVLDTMRRMIEPPASAYDLAPAGWPPPRAASAPTATATTSGAPPLTINRYGGSDHDDLEEAMFALRRIKRGGIYP